ncbi:MAG: hypothetical protein AAF561_04090 [Planctomycetota bacterium]
MRLLLPALLLLPAIASADVFRFAVDPDDGTVVIEGTEAFKGFTLSSTIGSLLPGNVPMAPGNPAVDTFLIDLDELIVFSPFERTTTTITAGTTGAPAPAAGFLADGDGYEIGQLVDVDAYSTPEAITDDLTLVWLDGADQVRTGQVVLVPEPTTLAFAGIASATLLRRRQSA